MRRNPAFRICFDDQIWRAFARCEVPLEPIFPSYLPHTDVADLSGIRAFLCFQVVAVTLSFVLSRSLSLIWKRGTHALLSRTALSPVLPSIPFAQGQLSEPRERLQGLPSSQFPVHVFYTVTNLVATRDQNADHYSTSAFEHTS